MKNEECKMADASQTNFFFVPAEQVCGHPYFLGIQFRYLAACYDANGPTGDHRVQVRVGLIWWHVGVSFNL